MVTSVKSYSKCTGLSAPRTPCVENVLADGGNGAIRCINLFVAVSIITNTMGCYSVVEGEDGPSRCYVSASLAYGYTESLLLGHVFEGRKPQSNEHLVISANQRFVVIPNRHKIYP